MEDSTRGGLILGGAAACPPAPDHHNLGIVVCPPRQKVGQNAGVDEGAGQDGPRATGCLHDAGPVRGREGDRGVRGYVVTQDLRGRVAEVEAGDLRAAPLPYAEVSPGGRSLFHGGDGQDPGLHRDEYGDGRARPESVDDYDYGAGSGGTPGPTLSAGVACD